MNEINFWPKFILAILATWRITHLLANEDGPADLVVRFRAQLGDGFAGQLLDCFYCLSVWVAAPLACFVGGKPLELLFIWLALSGAACLLERSGQASAVIQPISPGKERENSNGMLWSETSESQAAFGANGNGAYANTGQPVTHAQSANLLRANPTEV